MSKEIRCKSCGRMRDSELFRAEGRMSGKSNYRFSTLCDFCYSLWIADCIKPIYIIGPHSYMLKKCSLNKAKNRMQAYPQWFSNKNMRADRVKDIKDAVRFIKRKRGGAKV